MSRRRRLARFVGRAVVAVVAISLLVTLPLRWLDPPTSAFMIRERLAADQSRVTRYRWVDREHIAPCAGLAAVAAEDQRFPLHHGFDLTQIEKAARAWRRGERRRGASTISQQVVKNLYLWPARSLLRKGVEAYLTLWVELTWPKERILEVYVNIAQLGDGIFGVGAASEIYFGTTPDRLTDAQCALLAAVLPNPVRYSVAEPSEHVRERQRWILKQMRQLGGPAYLEPRRS